MASLYTDNDVALLLAELLNKMGHDTVTAREKGLARAGDDEHLLFAAQERRILISHNGKDYTLLHNAWRRWSQAWGVQVHHAGILIVPQSIPAAQLAWRINEIAGHELPLANELYRWQQNRGWTRSP